MGRDDGHKDGQAEKYSGHVFGDLGQDVAGARAEKGIRRARAKSHSRPGLLLGQLQQHQKDQNETIHKHQDRQKNV